MNKYRCLSFLHSDTNLPLLFNPHQREFISLSVLTSDDLCTNPFATANSEWLNSCILIYSLCKQRVNIRRKLKRSLYIEFELNARPNWVWIQNQPTTYSRAHFISSQTKERMYESKLIHICCFGSSNFLELNIQYYHSFLHLPGWRQALVVSKEHVLDGLFVTP